MLQLTNKRKQFIHPEFFVKTNLKFCDIVLRIHYIIMYYLSIIK